MMTKMTVAWILIGTLILTAAYLAWKLTSRNAYESAEYSVIQSEQPFEVREYPELLLATTEMGSSAQRDDGSFMRLFGYISGANKGQQKVAMTTPVFMEPESGSDGAKMGFVVPQAVAEAGAPQPSDDKVALRTRSAGRFAVIRFSGRLSPTLRKTAEAKLRRWMSDQGLAAEAACETAGYDPPWTPGPFRRNELLIRLR